MSTYWVYIIQSETNGKTYIGQTNNLKRRIEEHTDPACRLTLYTKRNPGPWKLIHVEEYATRAEALHRERWLKTGQGREWVKKLLTTVRTEGC